MWTPGLQLFLIGVLLQVPGCFPSCLIVGPVANCAFKNLRSVPPLPPHITHLYLEMNRIAEINSTSLSGLDQLLELDLGGQYVPVLMIRNNAFSRQRRLRRLVLGFNTGIQLEPKAFQGLSGLQNLYLDHCSLQNSILTENYLEPLSSLETLDLFGNKINRLQSAMFFTNMTNLKEINLKINPIDSVCESDVGGFYGKHFKLVNLDSVHFKSMFKKGFDWQKCGNPFRGMSFEKLDLSNNGFSVSKSKQFFRAIEGTKISYLKLSGHMGKGFSFKNLPDPDWSMFEGLKNSSVHMLDLSKNKIFALQQGVFNALREVAIIDISQNSLNQIHRNAFQGLQGSLKLLNLSHNLLGEVRSYTFASLTNLKVLDLSHNHIGVLGFGSFEGLPNLKALYLTGNSLRDLGYLVILPSLDYLMLNDNRLTSSSLSSLVRFAREVIHLNIQDNRFTNLGDVYTLLAQMEHLQSLYYGGNTISACMLNRQVTAADLKNFTVLELHGSSLQSIWSEGRCLNLFDNLGHVVALNLSFNALQALPQGIFKGLKAVEEMDLSSNALTYLQPDVLPKSLKVLNLSDNFIASPDPTMFSSLSFLNLKTNRFHCNQNLRSFMVWLSSTNVTLLSPVEEFRCEFPSGLYNVPLLEYSAQVPQQ